MPSIRQLYLNHVAQTSELPMMLEVDHAKGMYLYDTSGKEYMDMNSGISVSSLGHCHPNVIQAIQYQSEQYLHTMVYGEHIQSPQVKFAKLLTEQLDASLNAVYFLMSGTEAVEGAMKLAKRHTGRTKILACRNAYHGSTHGAESLRSDDHYKSAYLPLLPDIDFIDFNDLHSLDKIDCRTACVILEPIQAEAGVLSPQNNFLKAVRAKCTDVGALMVLDEIQTGFGRTGHLFAHQKYDVIPDIMTIGKAMGGGMPIAAFVASKELMRDLTKNPALGHITTFGGHPVCCAAAYATLSTLLKDELIQRVIEKETLIHDSLKHPIIKEIRSDGLMMAVELTKRKYLKHVVAKSLELGLLVDWFLFNDRSFRLAPPLIITQGEIKKASALFLQAMDFAQAQYS